MASGRERHSHGERRQPGPRLSRARSSARAGAARLTSARSAARPSDSSNSYTGMGACWARARGRGEKSFVTEVACGRGSRSHGERRRPTPRSSKAGSSACAEAAQSTTTCSAERIRDSSARSAGFGVRWARARERGEVPPGWLAGAWRARLARGNEPAPRSRRARSSERSVTVHTTSARSSAEPGSVDALLGSGAKDVTERKGEGSRHGGGLPAQRTLDAAVVDGGRRRWYVAPSERREQAYCSSVLSTLVLQGASTRGSLGCSVKWR